MDAIRTAAQLEISFGLVVIAPPPCDPPHHDLDDKAEMRHFDVEYRPAATTVH